MPALAELFANFLPFLVVLSALIFVHETGHYLMARLVGVPVREFSIGFWREALGWTDRRGTRWKLSLLPMGGYVRMAADFDGKALWQRTLVIAAGPAINFLFAIIIFALSFAIVGERVTGLDINAVTPGMPAEQAGIRPGDRILAIDGHDIQRWEDMSEVVLLHPGQPLEVILLRDGQKHTLSVAPQIIDRPDGVGGTMHDVKIGIHHTGTVQLVRQPPLEAARLALHQIGWLVRADILAGLQTLEGVRPSERSSGLVATARMTARSAHTGINDLAFFSAFLSTNIGLINLAPLPMLDGGNLLLYAIEAACGRRVAGIAAKYFYRLSALLLLAVCLAGLWGKLPH